MTSKRKKLIRECKQKLVDQRQLIGNMYQEAASELKSHEKAADINDVSSNVEMMSSSLVFSAHHQQTLREIDNALKLIEEGEWGYCESCGDEITGERLMAFPTATQCIDCKSKSEALGRQFEKKSINY